MKTNSTFYNAVDWVKTHGWDLWQQFDTETWQARYVYCALLQNGKTKSKARSYIATHTPEQITRRYNYYHEY